MSVGDHARHAFSHLPPALRRRLLHRAGRYAPWETGFDFTPPPPAPGEVDGPPDFVGIGVQKAGTTWWYRLILAHPEVSAPVGVHKERHFLDRFAIEPFAPAEIARYSGWFPRREGTLAGEWTPDYFHYPWVPPLLKQAAPGVRLLLLLRDPVERLRSGLAHLERMGTAIDTASVTDAVRRGFYHQALGDWLRYFDQDELLILQYERCAADPSGQLRATFEFLDLDEFRPPALGDHAGEPPATARAMLAPDAIDRLVTIYEPDVVALAARIPSLDLGLWPNFSYLAGSGRRRGDGASSPTPRR